MNKENLEKNITYKKADYSCKCCNSINNTYELSFNRIKNKGIAKNIIILCDQCRKYLKIALDEIDNKEVNNE